MREERLLERIGRWEKEPVARGGEDPKRMIGSVLEHLKRILNTKRGSVPIADDYGVPDFTDLLGSYPESVRDIEKTIRTVIQQYEPRLKAVRVTFIPQRDDPLSLSFQIAAKLSADSKSKVLFESVVGSDGRISLRG